MRRLGVMPYMTPLQRATESSTTPKSVMNTMVGGGCTADGCAGSGFATRNKANHRQKIRDDFLAGTDFIRIELSIKATSLLGIKKNATSRASVSPLPVAGPDFARLVKLMIVPAREPEPKGRFRHL